MAGFAAAGPATDEDLWPGTDAELYELHVGPEHASADGGDAGRLLNAVADTFAEDGFSTAYAWALADDGARIEFLSGAGWGLDGTRSNLDMGVKVPVVRLHTRLSRLDLDLSASQPWWPWWAPGRFAVAWDKPPPR